MRCSKGGEGASNCMDHVLLIKVLMDDHKIEMLIAEVPHVQPVINFGFNISDTTCSY